VRYKLIIFDFDGTLGDSFPWFARVLNSVADKYSFQRVASDKIDSLRGLNARELIRHLGVPRWKVPLIARHMRTLKGTAPIGLFDGVDRVLPALAKGGVTLAMVSSDNEDNIRRTLGPKLSSLISHYACGASLFGKGAKFRSVLRQSGHGAAEAIAIGDELRDLEAARSAGIAFGAVAWGYTRPDVLKAHAPDEMFNSIGEICDRLLGTNE
jgi:phosphoglycolate phosphatase